MTDLVDRINVIILKVNFIHLVKRHCRNGFTTNEFNIKNTVQCRINVFLSHLSADIFTSDCYWLIRIGIPNGVVRHHATIEVLHPLGGEAIFRQRLSFVARNEIIRMQAHQRIRSNQQRHICIVLHVIDVYQAFVHDDLRNTQEQRNISQTSSGRNPVVSFRCRRIVLRSNSNECTTTFHDLCVPMRFRHFIFNQVFTPLNRHFRISMIREVDIRGLHSMCPGMSRSLITMPGVV